MEQTSISREEVKNVAREAADKGRNEALALFSGFLLVVGTLSYFGLNAIVNNAIRKQGGDALLSKIKSYEDTAAEASDQIKRILEGHRQLPSKLDELEANVLRSFQRRLECQVVEHANDLRNESIQTSHAVCPDGFVGTGGGLRLTEAAPGAGDPNEGIGSPIHESRFNKDAQPGPGWSVKVRNKSGQNGKLVAQVICCRLTPPST